MAFVAPVDASASGPLTLTGLAEVVGLDAVIASALWDHMKLDPLRDAEAAAHISAERLKASIEDFNLAYDVALGDSGRINMIFARLERHRLSLEDPPVAAPAPVGVPTAPAPVAAAVRLKMSTVLDQHDDTSFEVLSDVKRAELRRNHQTTCGGAAPDGQRPSSEQLGAMMARLERGKSPYADFAVFQPHGGRLAMHHKFDAQIFVGGELSTRHLKGPINFASWKACWAVFRATMISLAEISPATLDAYERGLGQLVTLFPQNWGIIFCGDALTRSERWNEIAEGLKDSGSWPEHRPWDLVMRLTTYGGEDSTIAQQHWWSHRVIYPCQSTKPLVALQELEGTALLPMPGGMTSSSTVPDRAASSQQPHNNNRPRNKPKNKKQRHAAPTPYQAPAPHKGDGKGKGGKGKAHDGKGKGGKAPTK